jgi:membrane dipeptidase
MNRRTFLVNSAQLGCAMKLAALASTPPTLLAKKALAQKTTDTIPPAIDEMYRKAIVIDACGGINVNSFNLPVSPDVTNQAMQSGVTAINWTVSQSSFEDTVSYIAFVEGLAESDPAHWTMIRIHSDLDRAKRERKIGIMMGFQDTACLGAELDRIETFRRLGVRTIQLTYNNRGLYGDGCLEPANAGLSKLGRAAVAKMNKLGVAVDLSHCGQRTTAEAIEASCKPVLFTHTGCYAVHAHPRNKEDRELRAMADRGGVAGIYSMPYLVASPISPSREHVLQHLDHALKICGTDHVGIGSDGILDTYPDTPETKKAFQENIDSRKKQGIAAPEEDRPPYSPDLNRTDRLEIIATGLSRQGYSSDVIEKVLGKNFYRALGEIWGTA